MTVADQAKEAAIHCEMKKCGLRQSKDGIIVSFVLHPHEVPKGLQTADIGSRWMVVLVQIGDDETPLKPPPAEKSALSEKEPATPQPAPDKPSVGAKRDWRDVPPTEQAGIHCNDAVFIAFLKEHRTYDWNEARDAAECVRMICGVESRKLLNTDHRARMIWHGLDSQFQAWKIGERVGA